MDNILETDKGVKFVDVYDIEEYGLFVSLDVFASWITAHCPEAGKQVKQVVHHDAGIRVELAHTSWCDCTMNRLEREWRLAMNMPYPAEVPIELLRQWEDLDSDPSDCEEILELDYNIVEIGVEVK